MAPHIQLNWIKRLHRAKQKQLFGDKWHYHMTKYGSASAFFAKPLMKVPYECRTHLRERGRKSRTALLKKRTALWLKLQANLSPNLLYDKILID